MRRWILFAAMCVLAAGCSQPSGEAASELKAAESAEETAENPDADEAAAELESTTSLEPIKQFDFETAMGGIARIEAEVCDGDSVGTGFMIDERHIVTVAHVIEGATSILVEVNGDLAEAVTVGFDQERDIALLRSDIPLGDQTFELQDIDYTTGDQIFAIGFPRGLDASLTTGVISNREVEFDFMPFSRFIQVDAPLNPGNSGGPVFNEAGDVIGVVDWGISESQGLNFAISAESVDKIVEAWIGEPAVTAGACEPVEEGGEPAETLAPMPELPTAAWDEDPVAPPLFLADMARWWENEDFFDCRLLAPTELGEGNWDVNPVGGYRTGELLTSVEAEGAQAYISYWDLDNGNVLRFFEPGVWQQEYRGGGVARRLGDDVLLAIPGEECFYEISGVFDFEAGWFMALTDWFWSSLKRIDTSTAPAEDVEPQSSVPVRLIELTTSRGAPVLVPEGWTAEFIDGGGSGSWSVWTDPVSESQTVTVESGVSMGSWFELDGVSGSIDPTLLITPLVGAAGQLDRLDRYTFIYSGSDPSGMPVRGAWLATLDYGGSVCCFLQISVVGTDTQTATEIVDHFIESNRS